MIQTQLLKADKPYQIIAAAGLVGIQVATLIVTEEKFAEDGSYFIDTHSHPVVNYGNKDGLIDAFKYGSRLPDEDWKYIIRMQPEGAVWNKVEIRDVHVLGLVGANNPWVDLETFIDIVPSITPQDPLTHLWDLSTVAKMRNVFFSLDRVGLNLSRTVQNTYSNRFCGQIIYLELEEEEGYHQVLVKIRDEDYGIPSMPLYPLYFRCRLDDNPLDSVNTIGRCFAVLYNHFEFNNELKFIYNRNETDKGNKWADHLERVTEHLNNNWKTYLSEG